MTTRQLVLVRHAKAEADGGDDAQRRLAPRGERDAREVGRWLKRSGLALGTAAVSPARRAVQTWQLAVAELGRAPTTHDEDRIYHNTTEDLLAVVHETPAKVRSLVLVGHNPSIGTLAAELDDGAGDASAATSIAGNFPTSGIAVFEFSGAWAELSAGGATLTAFAVPRG